MKNLTVMMFGAGAALAVCADTAVVNPNGLLEAADTVALAAAVEATDADGLVLGNGMLKWTGTGAATWAGALTTAPVSNLEVTVNVADPGATLTIAGAAAAGADGVFLKTGPGTLELAGGGTVGAATGSYPWDSGWWKTYAGATSATFQPGVTTWDDATGVASGGGYSILTVADGTLRLNAPGQTFRIPSQPWIGNRLQNSPRLEVTNRTSVVSGGGVFCVARGTGTTANDAAPVVSVTDGGSLTVTQLSMGYPNGEGTYYSRARVELDDGLLTVSGGPIEQAQTDSGAPVIRATNGASVVCNYRATTDYGWLMRGAAETHIAAASTGAVRQIAHNPNTKLTVTGGSVFKVDRTVPKWYNQVADGDATAARVSFDGATLMRYSDVLADWFGDRAGGYTNVLVGADGLTLAADGPAWFGATPRAADADESRGGAIVKTGADALFMRPQTNLPVRVAEGTLGLTAANPLRTNDTAMAVTLAPGSRLLVGGEGALGGSEIAVPAGASVAFLGNAAPDNAAWRCNSFAKRLFDGTLQMTLGDTDSWGSAWRSNRVDVTGSFTVTFDSFTRCGANANAVEPYYGWMVVVQNKDTLRCGGNGDNYGYGGGTAGTAFTDAGVGSYAVGLNVLRGWFLSGRNGAKPTTSDLGTDAAVDKMDLAASLERPCRNTFTYDAANHTATLAVFIPSLGRTVTHTETVDLAALCGETAFIGFTASTHSARNSEHCIRNVRVATAAAKPDTLHVDGTLDASAAGALAATLGGNDAIGTFAVGALKGTGAVTLDLTDAGMYPEETYTPLSSTDESLWTFAGAGHRTDDGPACSTGTASAGGGNGGFISNAAYPVTGSWRLSCDWKSGLEAGRAPADVLWLSLDNYGKPYNLWGSDGLTLRIAHYVSFNVNFYVKGVAQPIGADGATTLNLYTDDDGESWFDLRYKGDLHIEIAHDAAAKTLAVTLAQQEGAESKTFVIADFDAATVFGGKPRARVRGYQVVGGSWAEGIYANFSFTGDEVTRLTAAHPARSALAFARTEGVTSVTTTGDALLAFLAPGVWTAPVTVRGAGLRFAAPSVEDVRVGAGGGWVFNQTTGGYAPGGGVKIGSNVANNRDNAHYRHRVRATGDWRASWTLRNVDSKSADGISFFLHNDPRGSTAVGGANGCGGLAKCFAIGWYTYANASPENKWGLSRNQNGIYWQESVAPVTIRSGEPIDVTLTHAAAAKTVTLKMTQGENEYSTVIEDVDLKAYLGDNDAWLGFGSAGGGLHTLPVFDNFAFEQLDADADPLADTAYLPSVTIAADADIVLDTVAGRTFRVAEALTVEDGRTLRAFAADKAATLAAGTLTLGAGAGLAGAGAATFAPDALAGDLTTLALDNAVLALPAADVAAGRFAGTSLALANGAAVRVAAGVCTVNDVTVDGAPLPPGVWTAENCAWVKGGGKVNTVRATVIILR